MSTRAPGAGRIAVMVLFTLSVAGLLLFLWISFGGVLPLKPERYRVQVAFPDAAMLVQEADVRMAGITIGKVKELDLMKRPPRSVATLSIDPEFAPLPADVRAMLRQKTLLGETYVELSPGTREGPTLDDGARLPLGQVSQTVELDEIFQAFDPSTREAIQDWIGSSARSIRGRSQELNAALGNLPHFLASGRRVLEPLDARREALGRFVRNTGVVFGAINQERGALRDLIVSSERLFDATAARDDALAQTIEIFPTFLDESRATLRRLEEFSRDTLPLVRDLRPVARDLGPTLRDLGDLSPDLANLFRDVDALADVAPRTLPDAERVLREARPVMRSLNQFLPELNPVLSYLGFQAPQVADFITVGGAATAGTLPAQEGDRHPRHYLRQIGVIGTRSLALNATRPPYERANAYLAPNAWQRMRPLGVLESFDCAPAGGRKPAPEEGEPPCFVSPPSLWDGHQYFPRLTRGNAPLERPPDGNEGTRPARP